MIDTTVYVQRTMLDLLDGAAERAGVGRRDLVSALLKLVSRRERRNCRARECVRYQERNGDAGWTRVHVKLRDDEYEFFLDLRKMMKMSVSFLISRGIDKYLDELVALLIKDPDNYQYRNYAFMNIILEDVSCWLICWGIPPQTLVLPGFPG